MTVGVAVREDVAVGRIARAEVWAVGTAGEGALEGRENTSGPRATVWPRHHRACVLWCAVCCAASLPSERKRESRNERCYTLRLLYCVLLRPPLPTAPRPLSAPPVAVQWRAEARSAFRAQHARV